MKKIYLALVLGILLISVVSAVEVSNCCEKTITGAWCQNADASECDSSFRSVPTSCEATSYCKMGCCYNSQEGTCMENTPQKVCEEGDGVWAENAECDIPQCSLGCCLIGDQAAFVTQTRCKRLSSLYGLEINFRKDIQNEMQCIASATSDVKGACVYEEDYARTCKFITKRECIEMGASITGEDSSVEFHEGYLCSAETLATNCGPTEETTCVEGKDEVYFVDSCGNIANIYDASKINDKEYWTKIYDKTESCGYAQGDGNPDSETCGNCDYYLGSTCKKYERGQDSRPKYGDYICRDLACEYKGVEYQHGETWCANAAGTDENLPGSRYFRMVCYNNEVSVEPCADFRQEICIQSSVNGFKSAACAVNMWQDCTLQDNQDDCENTDRRDCQWLEGIMLNTGLDEEEESRFTGAFLGIGSDDGDEEGEECEENSDCAEGLYCKEGFCAVKAACVPAYAPGFDFWEAGSEAEIICAQASTTCIVTYEKGLIGSKKCKENCECLSEEWEMTMNEACVALGDCGISTNYLGIEGFNKAGNTKKSVSKDDDKTDEDDKNEK